MNRYVSLAVLVSSVLIAGCHSSPELQEGGTIATHKASQPEASTMQLGAFSISLAVKDLAASKAFYEKLGFTPIGGAVEQNYLILRNGEATVGLFQGMFEQNILTFNPGWSGTGEHPKSFTDVRVLQKTLKGQGIAVVQEADEASTGPASFVVVDPDGNPILIDQHVSKP